MDAQKICKDGIIKKIDTDTVWVEITVSSACGACAAKKLCNISEQKNELFEAKNLTGDSFAVGEEVQIMLQQKLARKAVILGYFLPFVVLIVGLFGCYAITHSEGISALVALALTAIYFLFIKLIDKHLSKEFVFYVVKK